MKTILITGGSGFIGSNLTEYLLKKYSNIRIINVDKLTYASNFSHLEFSSYTDRYVFVKSDILEEMLISKLLGDYDVDTIINLAGETSVDKSIENDDDFIRTNIMGAHSLLKAAKRVWCNSEEMLKKHRFIQISTDEVHGSLSSVDAKLIESSLIKPRNPYSATKSSAEHLVTAYNESHGLPVMIVRLPNNYGPKQYPDKLIPKTIKCCLNKEKIPIYGDGLSKRNWIYVKDTCEAIDILMNSEYYEQINIIGGNFECTNINLVKKIIKYFNLNVDKSVNEDLITFIKGRKGANSKYSVDSSKMNNKYRWKAKTTFDCGIVETIEWYIKNPDYWVKKH